MPLFYHTLTLSWKPLYLSESFYIITFFKVTFVCVNCVPESSDDDKITQYKWEEMKGPLNDKNKKMSSGVDSPVLQLKSLVPGIYTFK